MKITQSILADRLETCRTCPRYHGVCFLGHVIASTYGCPIKKFAPVGSAPYLVLNHALIKQLTWPDILHKFAVASKNWILAGVPVVNKERHSARFTKCRSCPLYKTFQCTSCRCIAYIKAKLATETCPENAWPMP